MLYVPGYIYAYIYGMIPSLVNIVGCTMGTSEKEKKKTAVRSGEIEKIIQNSSLQAGRDVNTRMRTRLLIHSHTTSNIL